MYKLFVPCFYTENPSATGPAMPQPDTSLLASPHQHMSCRRFRLPTRIGDLRFTFPVSFEGGEKVSNFYHMGDYFLVAEDVQRLFAARFGDDLETCQVHMHHADGRPCATPYWAVFVRRIVDCIDPQASCVEADVFADDDNITFAQALFSMPLGQECARDFANDGSANYCTYPDWHRVRNLALRSGALPQGQGIVQPRLWPGCWLIETDFESVLQAACTDGYDGYCFWTLGLDAICEEYSETQRALR